MFCCFGKNVDLFQQLLPLTLWARQETTAELKYPKTQVEQMASKSIQLHKCMTLSDTLRLPPRACLNDVLWSSLGDFGVNYTGLTYEPEISRARRVLKSLVNSWLLHPILPTKFILCDQSRAIRTQRHSIMILTVLERLLAACIVGKLDILLIFSD